MNNNIMGMLKMFMGGNGGGLNPQALMQQFGNNPMMGRAQEMAKGKSPEEMEQLCRNMCKQQGMDFDQLKGMASQFGFKL